MSRSGSPAPLSSRPMRRRARRCRCRQNPNCRIRPRPGHSRASGAQEHFVAAPREFHAAEPAAPLMPPVPPRAISEILGAARRTAARRDRAGAAAGSSAGAGHTADRADVVAVGAHRRFRKRAERNSDRSERAGLYVELHRRCPPRRASGCRQCAPPTRRRKKLPPSKAREKAKAKIEAKAGAKTAPRPTASSLRPSPRRSARCWSAPAWS